MNYRAFTNESLTMMYEGVRGALESDDELVGLDEQPRFRVERTPDVAAENNRRETFIYSAV